MHRKTARDYRLRVFSLLKSTLTITCIACIYLLNSSVLSATPINASGRLSKQLAKITVTGKVTDEIGQALPAASVTEKGTSNGTLTDEKGRFTLSVEESAVIVINYVGYSTQEISVSGRGNTNIDVKMELTSSKIDEVVVIGYGTAVKRDLTGSITKIDGKEVADRPNTNPIASLQGKVAGLSVINSGTPGQAPDIRIRGTISIGSIKVLYVVDGILTDNIDYLNPNDIESIEVLKDASSLAIFGVRGASGVIAITTKKAKAGQFNVSYNAAYGTRKLVDKIKWADAAQFKTLFEEEKENIGVTDPFDYSKWNNNTDWIDAVTRTGKFNNHNLSINGASDKNRFSMSMGYVSDDGIIRHENQEKFQFSINDELKVSSAFKVGFNINSARIKNPYDINDYAQYVLNDARKVIPQVPATTISIKAKNPYGPEQFDQNLYYILPNFQNSGVVNPLIQLENTWDKTKNVQFQTVASVYGELTFLKNFNLRATLYGDKSDKNRRAYNPLYNAYELATGLPYLYSQRTSINELDETSRKWQSDLLLNYKKSFGSHNLTALAGFTANYSGYFGRSASAFQGATPIPNDPRLWYITNGFADASTAIAKSSQNERSTASGLFRVLYNYNYKYYLNASFRQDASSQIAPQNRKQNFWAVGAAWDVSQEGFMKSLNVFDFFKLKASIGVLGNQNTYGFDYPIYPALSPNVAAVFGGPSNFNIFPAFTQNYFPAPDLKWETVLAKEVGFEADILKNKLHIEGAYYDKTTRDLMTYIPPISGGFAELKNVGKINNSGFELSATLNQRLTSDLSLTVSGNITTYKNKVLELATDDFTLLSGRNRTVVGLPIGHFYGYVVEGIYQSYADKLASPVNTEFAYGPGDLKYKDINGDGVISTKDRTMIGNPTPDFSYGSTVNLNFKQFNLGVDLGGVYGNEVYREWGGTESPFQRVNYPDFKINRWHGAGTSNWDPILGQDHRINYESSTYGIEDGSYFRLRNVQLGYNFSPDLAARLKAKNVRLYVNVQNLKTFKHNLGYSPEFGGDALSFGVDRAGGALPRTTTFGLNVTF